MDLKKTIGRIGKEALLKQAANKILPMEGDKPRVGPKAKAAGALALIATVATMLSQYLGG